ncbi:MAG: VWA domain-containing protein [Bacteroidales bacterium]|nr:VWA domain-containing protein [Bacteroidales bacterium]MCF8392062.1 VWA domain-containing protein [Bacteroidales bacterium]
MRNTTILISFSLFLIFLSSCETDSYLKSDSGSLYNTLAGYESAWNGGEYTGENYQEYEENPFIKVVDQPVSTFSVDADGGAYSNMRRYFRNELKPPTAAVRIEEFINYFTFDYEDPQNGENISMNTEISTCPWNESHHLLRIGIKGKSLAENEIPASNFVFLIDVSGSMDSSDKLGILKTGFKRMTDQLTQNDRIAIVTYAGAAAVLLQSTSGDQKTKIKDAIGKLGAGGSTAGAQGIITAYEIAEQNFIEGGNNRIILGSDGDFNVGPSSTEELIELIKEKRESDIYLTVLGVGGGNLNDHMMEQIANNGNGNYEYIDNEEQIEKVFVNEKSKFFTVAKDSKFQITFNPNMVDAYRLIGYENRMLQTEDFEKDTVDAGEIGAGQTITAMYEIQLYDVLNAEKYGTLDFRYKFPDEDVSRMLNQDILTWPVEMSAASENQRFAAAITGFGLILRESQYKGTLTKQMIIDLGKNALGFDEFGYREECVRLMGEL